MKDSIPQVVLLGESGFPFGMAAIEKIKLIGKGLTFAGAKVTSVNRKGSFNPDRPIDLEPRGVFEGVHYVYTSGTVYRPKSFIARNWAKIKGVWGEFVFLYRKNRRKELDYAVVSSMDFGTVLYYRLLSRLFKFRLLLIYQEMSSAMAHHQGIRQKINDQLFDNFSFQLSDGVLPISQLLTEQVQRRAPGKPCLRLPLLCDFDKFQVKKNKTAPPYLLYCGSADYYEVIEFIIAAYDRLPEDTPADLFLVVGGGAEAKARVKNAIRQMKKRDRVKMFSNLPYKELVQFFVDAKGLLIPLRPTLQDAARFPHKIGEYLASKNPIVTTNYGEVRHYFQDGETALIAAEYDVRAYSEKMNDVLQHPEEAWAIGQNAYQMGVSEFDYRVHGKKLIAFFRAVDNKEHPSTAKLAEF